MKRFLSVILAAALLLPAVCLAPGRAALAESVSYPEMGLSLDMSAVEEKSVNYPSLVNWGVLSREPYSAAVFVAYFPLPRDMVKSIEAMIESTGDEAEQELLGEALYSLYTSIGTIFVTDADTPGEGGLEDPLPEGYELTEFGTLGSYHYYYVNSPADRLIQAYAGLEGIGLDAAALEEKRDADIKDIRTVQAEVLRMLQAAELSEPQDPDDAFIGRVIRFETTDLDGNTVRSEDLFRDNRITMVNAWGTWCINCLNEMPELARIHERLREKGCGIVGVEWEKAPMELVEGTARRILAENGITYPNVLRPENDPVFSALRGYPTTFFVDSEGTILARPIVGAYVQEYEAAVDRLLAGEAAGASAGNSAAGNESGEYRVFVYDREGNPVKGAVVEFCDDITCTYRKTGADGAAVFQADAPGAYDVHVLKVPAGYADHDAAYRTPETYSDISILIDRAD